MQRLMVRVTLIQDVDIRLVKNYHLKLEKNSPFGRGIII